MQIVYLYRSQTHTHTYTQEENNRKPLVPLIQRHHSVKKMFEKCLSPYSKVPSSTMTIGLLQDKQIVPEMIHSNPTQGGICGIPYLHQFITSIFPVEVGISMCYTSNTSSKNRANVTLTPFKMKSPHNQQPGLGTLLEP